LVDEPFQVKAGEKIRFYVANVGPNELSSFHVISPIFDDVYMTEIQRTTYKECRRFSCQQVAVQWGYVSKNLKDIHSHSFYLSELFNVDKFHQTGGLFLPGSLSDLEVKGLSKLKSRKTIS
jgi:hypothetical protein